MPFSWRIGSAADTAYIGKHLGSRGRVREALASGAIPNRYRSRVEGETADQ
jgi:hypothetical protein